LERAVELKPEDPTINDHLGDAYWKVGRELEAQFQWSHARDLKPEADELPKIEDKLKFGLRDEPGAAAAAEKKGGGNGGGAPCSSGPRPRSIPRCRCSAGGRTAIMTSSAWSRSPTSLTSSPTIRRDRSTSPCRGRMPTPAVGLPTIWC